MKNVLYIGLLIVFVAIGSFIGHFIHHHLKDMGVTFITIGDIFGCYFFSIIAVIFIWGFLFLKKLD